MPDLQKQSVLGIGISPTSYGEVAEACCAWIAKPEPGGHRYICVTSVHGIMTAVFDTADAKVVKVNAVALNNVGLPSRAEITVDVTDPGFWGLGLQLLDDMVGEAERLARQV